MKNKSFLFRSIFEKVVKGKQRHKQRSNDQFAALMMEMIAHSLFGGIATTIIGTILGFTAFGGLFLDVYANLAPPSESSEEVTVVTIGPESLYLWDANNPEPEVTPRGLLAELVNTLHDAGARTIVLDVLLDSSQQNDDALAEAAIKHGAVIGAEQSAVTQPRTGRLFAKGITPTLKGLDTPAIYPAQANLFFTEPMLFTGDLIFRGVHLAQLYQRSSIEGTWPDTIVGAREEVISPSLSLAGAWLHQARKESDNANYNTLLRELKDTCSVELGKLNCESHSVSGLPPFQSLLHQDFWLHHMGSEQNDALPFLPASTLLMLTAERQTFKRLGIPDDQLPPTAFPESVTSKLKDKLVVVGRVDRLGQPDADRYPTTYSFPLFKKHDMAGVRIQAQLMDALLSGRRVHFMPWWFNLLLIPVSILLTLSLYRKVPIVWQTGLWLIGLLLSIGIGYVLFVYMDGWVLELGPAITASLVTLMWLYTRYEWLETSNDDALEEDSALGGTEC